MGAKFQVNINQFRVKQLENAAKKALGETAESLKTTIEQAQVIPFDVGTLQESMTVDKSLIDDGEIRITMSTPYARRLYFHPEYNFQTKNNPNAKAHWFEDWLPGGQHSKTVAYRFGKLYRKELMIYEGYDVK